MKKVLKVLSTALLSVSLVACSGGMSESEKEEWAVDNGYLKSEEELQAWAEENGYIKGEALLTWAVDNGYTKIDDIDFDKWALDNGYLKGDVALDAWADDNGYLKDTSDLNDWATENGYIKGNSALDAWAREHGYLKGNTALNKWALDNGYLKSNADLEKWAKDNGYIKDEEDLIAWAENNGYVKDGVADTSPRLELSFGNTMFQIDANYLKNYIGGINDQGTITFGEQKDVLVFYGVNECASCEAIKPIINQWVKETGYAVYYYNPDESSSVASVKAEILRKLGSTDGYTLEAAQLIAFVDGEYRGKLNFSDINSGQSQSITNFVSKYYKLDVAEKTVKSSKDFLTLADLRKSIANNEQFILYATRFNCPWCRKLADTGRDNVITRLMTSYTGSLNRIISENVLAEYNNIYVKGSGDSLALAQSWETGAVNVWEYWYSLDNGAIPDVINEGANMPYYWPNTTVVVQKADILIQLVATGEVGSHVTDGVITNADQIAFIKEVAAYAADTTRVKKFGVEDRNAPAFTAVNWTLEQEEANTKALSAIIARRSSSIDVDFDAGTVSIVDGNAHRLLFPEYFTGATSGVTNINIPTPQLEVDAAFYYLTQWMNSWVYNS